MTRGRKVAQAVTVFVIVAGFYAVPGLISLVVGG
jgi:hypothetical protein